MARPETVTATATASFKEMVSVIAKQQGEMFSYLGVLLGSPNSDEQIMEEPIGALDELRSLLEHRIDAGKRIVDALQRVVAQFS